jgi:putative hydrolase of the HAD superfamily
MPYASETLIALKQHGARVFLLSNAQACFTNDELAALGLSDKFNGILLSSDAGMKKPYRGLFQLLLDRYAIDRGTAVMVGNDAVADIGGAAAAGLFSFYYHTWQSGAHPDALPPSCREIPDLSALIE